MTSGQYSCQIFINRNLDVLYSILYGVKLSVECQTVSKKKVTFLGDLCYKFLYYRFVVSVGNERFDGAATGAAGLLI